MSNKMIGHFEDKPVTASYCRLIDSYLQGLPGIQKELKAQLSYKVKRKFCWLWAYEKTADGTLFISLLLDEEVRHGNIHSISQVILNKNQKAD